MRSLDDLDYFQQLVAQAIDDLPDEFRAHMENVEIIVDDFADSRTLESLGIPSRWHLLGLYLGVPHNRRSVFAYNPLPDTIHLYRRPIEMATSCHEDLKDQIRSVLLHEIGHHFGFDEAQLEELEERSR